MVLSVANCQLLSFVWFFQVQVMQGQSRLQNFHWFIIGHNSLLGVVVFDGTVSDPGPASPSNKREKILKMDPCWSNNDFWRSLFRVLFGNFFWKLFIPTRLPSRLQFWEATKGLVSTHWNCAQGIDGCFRPVSRSSWWMMMSLGLS